MESECKLTCSECRSEFPEGHAWCCRNCCGPLQLEDLPFRADAILKDDHSLWRYRAMLAVGQGARIVTMGEGMTPLVAHVFAGRNVHFKLEYVSPTGSFKDRGTSVLVTKLCEWAVTNAADDSSGNAGASLAAYCAHAGIHASIFVPAHASRQKQSQIRIFDADLTAVDGPRERSTEKLIAELKREDGLVYASHAWSPFTQEGTKTIAYELWEQLRPREPDCFVSPIGQGSLFLGAYRGFKVLRDAGLISRLPRMIGVQSDACAPIVEAVGQGLEHPASITSTHSIAEGIALPHPIHGRAILKAIKDTNGTAIAVSDNEIRAAQSNLARIGLYVEPTSAVVGAALAKTRLEGIIVVALTGTGLKTPIARKTSPSNVRSSAAIE